MRRMNLLIQKQPLQKKLTGIRNLLLFFFSWVVYSWMFIALLCSYYTHM